MKKINFKHIDRNEKDIIYREIMKCIILEMKKIILEMKNIT